MVVDREVVDDRVHGIGQRRVQLSLRLKHQLLNVVLRFRLPARIEDEAHAPTRHPSKHQEPPECLAVAATEAFDQGLGVVIGRPGDDGLDGLVEILGGQLGESALAWRIFERALSDVTSGKKISMYCPVCGKILPVEPQEGYLSGCAFCMSKLVLAIENDDFVLRLREDR